MSQKSIRSYFTPSKRPLATHTGQSDSVSPTKKRTRTTETTDNTDITEKGGDDSFSTPSSKTTKEPLVATPKLKESGGNLKNFFSAAKSEQNNASEQSEMIQKRIDDLSKKFVALSSNIGHSWFLALEPEFKKKYFATLSSFLAIERRSHTIYPPENEVFSWTRFCKIRDVKVVIIGQDPYHGPKQAHGLCFSVQKGVAVPPSLLNMYKELQNDIKDFNKPHHGNLIGWAKQGVLLLNACLTVRESMANSHASRGWENLTDAVIKWLNENNSNLVFMLWGSYAQVSIKIVKFKRIFTNYFFIFQKKSEFISSSKHLVLKSAHPSPLSASRGFFGCKHFSKANEYLVKKGKPAIDWNDLP